MDIEEIRREIKRKKKQVKIKKNKNNNLKFLNQLALTIIFTLITLICLKTNPTFKTNFYKIVFKENISFVSINNLYKKYLGNILPNFSLLEETKPVFNEKLIYSNQSKYKDGVALTVEKNYLVPILDSGMVVFVGDKDEYGKTVIIEQVDGLEVWYSNLSNYSVKLYDYVEKGTMLGEVISDKLYLVFKKNGETLEYEDKL